VIVQMLLCKTNSRHVQLAYHGPRQNGQMVLLDRYAYGIAQSVLCLSTLRSFLVGIQFDVTTPLKPFHIQLYIYKKLPDPSAFSH
jgi:hypothetical protein